jgi:hypothetical protein
VPHGLSLTLQLGQKPAFLAVMALAITTAVLAMMTVHEALSVAVNVSASAAGLPLQQETQQMLLQQQSGRLADAVPHRLLLATHNVSAAIWGPWYDAAAAWRVALQKKCLNVLQFDQLCISAPISSIANYEQVQLALHLLEIQWLRAACM